MMTLSKQTTITSFTFTAAVGMASAAQLSPAIEVLVKMKKSTPLIGEVSCNAALTKARNKPTPERLPPPETRFHLGGRSFEEMQQGRYRPTEEVLAMAVPRGPSVTVTTDLNRTTPSSCINRGTQAQCIELLHSDTEEVDPPSGHWSEDLDGDITWLDGEFLMKGPNFYVIWKMSEGFIWTSCGGHLHEVLSTPFPCPIDGDLPPGYQYRRDGMDMFTSFLTLPEAIEYVEREIEYQYRFERIYWPWVLRLPEKDQSLILSYAHYCVRAELLELKYSIPNRSWLARRAAPTGTTD
jgi:hypothetical protein